MSALLKPRLTEDEYLAIEHEAEFRSEYIDGEMYAMAGAGEEHNLITGNIHGVLWQQFKGRPCKVYMSDMRVRAADSGLYTYPDVVALCGSSEILRAKGDTLLNPQLIVEVSSPSTAFYDRVEKFRRYQQIASFTDYLLVSQDEMFVEHRRRQADVPQGWVSHQYDQPADRIELAGLGARLTLAEIYDEVSFPAGPLKPSYRTGAPNR